MVICVINLKINLKWKQSHDGHCHQLYCLFGGVCYIKIDNICQYGPAFWFHKIQLSKIETWKACFFCKPFSSLLQVSSLKEWSATKTMRTEISEGFSEVKIRIDLTSRGKCFWKNKNEKPLQTSCLIIILIMAWLLISINFHKSLYLTKLLSTHN